MTDALKRIAAKYNGIIQRRAKDEEDLLKDEEMQTLLECALEELATDLTADNAALREALSVAQSQVDNADINLEQVRMAMKSNHQREIETLRAQLAEKEAALALEVSNHNSTVDRSAELLAELEEKERELKYTKLSENILRADANASKLESHLLRSTLIDVRDQNEELRKGLTEIAHRPGWVNEDNGGSFSPANIAHSYLARIDGPLPQPPEEK